MKKWILIIASLLTTTLAQASSWEDPSWVEMIRDAEIIGLFEIVEGGIDHSIIAPLDILKGNLETNITVQGFNNNCASEEWQQSRALNKNKKVYLFLHQWRGKYTTPTPSTGTYRLHKDDTINYFTFTPTCFENLPPHPAVEFEEFISNTVWFQKNGDANQDRVEKLRLTIQEELTELNTNSLPDNLVYYRLWGGRDWINGMEAIIDHPWWIAQEHAAKLLGAMLPSANAEALLLKLLNDPRSMTQGQAATALMNAGNTNETLALLTKKLGSSSIQEAGQNNHSIGGQRAIIKEIRKHEYIAATNELIAVAKTTQNSIVFRNAFSTLEAFDSHGLSDLIAIQLKSDNTHVVDDAIKLSRNLPKPVKRNVREALEQILLTTDLDNYETSTIFKSLTSESLPVIRPKIESILNHEKPKWGNEDYLIQAIELVEDTSSSEDHYLVDQILYYWTGVSSQAVSSPNLLKKKIELENHYKRTISRTKIIDKNKYKTKSSAIVFIDFTKATATPNAKTPIHTFHVDVEMTVPTGDPNSPYNAIKASYKDKSVTSPLLTWRREIATENNVPISTVGIFCHPSSGKGGDTNNVDKRIQAQAGIMRAYVDYAKRTQNKDAAKLIKLMLKTRLAHHMDCADICHKITN